jgi:hypothetical protein
VITAASNYGEVMATIQAAVADVAADLGLDPLEVPDDVFHDVAVSVLYDADPEVGAEVCRTQFGWVPTELHNHWHAVRTSDRPRSTR